MNITYTMSVICVLVVYTFNNQMTIFFDHKWRKTFFIVWGHMMIRRTDYCMVVLN